MNEDTIRQIVRDEMQRNYQSGSPLVAPHFHNQSDGLPPSQTDLKEFLRIPSYNAALLSNPVSGVSSLQDATGNLPLPVIFGSGSKGLPNIKGQEGNILVFWTGSYTASILYFYIDGDWRGINFTIG